MKVFIVGGTGLLGSEGAKVLIERGHEVTAIALPPLPAGAELPPEMKVEFGNYLELSDDELRQHLTGMDAIGTRWCAGRISPILTENGRR